MSIYHCSIKMVGRTGGKSAVAASAYRSGEKLYDEETGLTHDFTRKGGVVMSEILLPEKAPEEYSDRQILWNAVQAVEKRSDAQMAREVEVALPIEMSREQQIECIRNYVMENFVNEGMIADWALHDKGDGISGVSGLSGAHGRGQQRALRRQDQGGEAAHRQRAVHVRDACVQRVDIPARRGGTADRERDQVSAQEGDGRRRFPGKTL